MAFLVSFEDSDSESDSAAEPKTPTSSFPSSFTAPRANGDPTTQPTQPINLPLRPSQNHSSTPLFPPSENMSRPVPPANKMDTPPSTPPTNASISKRSDAHLETPGRRSIDSTISDAPPLSSTPEIKQFPYTHSDYTLAPRPPLGEGLWSTVYLAHPSSPPPPSPPTSTPRTPPLTPIAHRSRANTTSAPAQLYAIKTPTSRSARAVLAAEARILTYLSALLHASTHLVPFHGVDPRTGALVLGALPTTLETYIHGPLAALSEADRGARLAALFPRFALRVVDALGWIHAAGVVHADLKVSNILLALATPASFPVPYFADFSSAIPPPHFSDQDEGAEGKAATPLGGGTWDYLSPALLRPGSNPTPRTDVHALAVCLLYLVFGASPFEAVGANVFLRREMVKQNQAVQAGVNETRGWRRLSGLEKGTGWGLRSWVERGLGDGVLDWGAWRGEVEGVVRRVEG